MADWGAGFVGGIAGLLNALDKYKREQREEQLAMMQLQQKSGLYDIEPVPATDLTPAPFFSRLLGQRWQPIGGQAVIPYGTSGGALTLRPTPRAINLPPTILGDVGMDTEDPQVQQLLARTPAKDLLKQYWENQQFMRKQDYAEGVKSKQTAIAEKRNTLNRLRIELGQANADPEWSAALQTAIAKVTATDPNDLDAWADAIATAGWAIPKMGWEVDETTGARTHQQRGPIPQRITPGAVVEKPGPAAPATPGMIGAPAAAPAEPAAPGASGAPGAPGAPGTPPKRTLTPEQISQRTALYGVPPALVSADHLTESQLAKTRSMAESVGANPADVLTAFSFETGGTMNPAKKNPRSSATGLIQFIEKTANSLGTSTEELRKMSYEDQLDWVQKYLSPYSGRIGNLKDLYMAILKPSMIGAPLDAAVFTRNTVEYGPNRELDKDDNGIVTVREALDAVMNHARGKGAVPTVPAAAPPTAVAQAPTPAPGTAAPGTAAPGTAAPARKTRIMTDAELAQWEREQQTNKEQKAASDALALERKQSNIEQARQEARQRSEDLATRKATIFKKIQELRPNVAAENKPLLDTLVTNTRKAATPEQISEIEADMAGMEELPAAAKPMTANEWFNQREQTQKLIRDNAVVGKETETQALLDEVLALKPGDDIGLLAINNKVKPVNARLATIGPDGREYLLTPSQTIANLQKGQAARESARRWNKRFLFDAKKYVNENLSPAAKTRANELLAQGDEKFDETVDYIIASPQETFEVYDPVLKTTVPMNRKDALDHAIKYAPQVPAEVELQLQILSPGETLNTATSEQIAAASAAAAEKKRLGAVAYFNAMEHAKINAPISHDDSLLWVHPKALQRQPGPDAPKLHPVPGGLPLDAATAGYVMIGTKGLESLQAVLEARSVVDQMYADVPEIFGPHVDPSLSKRFWKTVTTDYSRAIQDPLGVRIKTFEGNRMGLSTILAKSIAKDSGHLSDQDREAILNVFTPIKNAGLTGLANSRALAEAQFASVYKHLDSIIDRITQGEYKKFLSTGQAPGATAPATPAPGTPGVPGMPGAPGAPGAPGVSGTPSIFQKK